MGSIQSFFFYTEDGLMNEDGSTNELFHCINPIMSSYKCERPTAKFISSRFDPIMKEISSEMGLDVTKKEDRQVFGEMALRYVNAYDLYHGNEKPIEKISIKEEDEYLWEGRHGRGKLFQLRRVGLAFKIMFVMVLLAMVLFIIITAATNKWTDSTDDTIDQWQEVIEIIEIPTLILLGIALIGTMKPGKSGFYQLPEPIDMFIAFIAGILLIVTAIKNSMELIQEA